MSLGEILSVRLFKALRQSISFNDIGAIAMPIVIIAYCLVGFARGFRVPLNCEFTFLMSPKFEVLMVLDCSKQSIMMSVRPSTVCQLLSL